MNETARSVLIDAVQRELMPILASEGFGERSEMERGKGRNREFQMAFPVSRLVRQKGGQLELVEIQFDKHGAPRFIVNFGVVPEDGVTLPWGHFAAAEVGVSSLPKACRLYSRPLLWSWFGLGLFPRDIQRRATNSARRATSLVPELLRWFETSEMGRHIRVFGMPGSSLKCNVD